RRIATHSPTRRPRRSAISRGRRSHCHAASGAGHRRCGLLRAPFGHRPSAQPTLHGMTTHVPKILVVDDTRANLVAMRHLLADSGAELVEASSGNEALSKCLDQHFALILLDVN